MYLCRNVMLTFDMSALEPTIINTYTDYINLKIRLFQFFCLLFLFWWKKKHKKVYIYKKTHYHYHSTPWLDFTREDRLMSPHSSTGRRQAPSTGREAVVSHIGIYTCRQVIEWSQDFPGCYKLSIHLFCSFSSYASSCMEWWLVCRTQLREGSAEWGSGHTKLGL